MLGAPGHNGHDAAERAQEQTAAAAAARPSSPRGLVLASAGLLHRGDVDGARRAADEVLSTADPRGDAADRLAHHFARVLARRVNEDRAAAGDVVAAAPAPAGGAPPPAPRGAPTATAYLAYNQIAPFLRFAHLTANQAILDAAASGGARRLHIVDLDAAHGVQWPPLLQAIADSADPAVGPPEVRITGAGPDRDVLLRTGDRLRAFAGSLNLPFRFHPLLLPCTAQLAADPATGLELHPDETLAVNCVLFLHRLRGEGEVATFLQWVKSMNPAVVTIAEKEASSSIGSDDCPPDDLPRRVAAAMGYYSAMFDALEATVPPGSADRFLVESEVLGREIDAALALEPGRVGEHTWGFEAWASAARAAGLSPRPLSAFAVSQARLLLRLHYPSEGYVAEEARGACFLGWQTRPLMSVSSWQ
ncbi:protein MONOCULM 1-like [Miscanthus floridulus]|uniref:protein MONOCULM 1-like n=1 Tax=Miscanthus floridulus TaxID=154761 RepID=UPI003459A4D3